MARGKSSNSSRARTSAAHSQPRVGNPRSEKGISKTNIKIFKPLKSLENLDEMPTGEGDSEENGYNPFK